MIKSMSSESPMKTSCDRWLSCNLRVVCRRTIIEMQWSCSLQVQHPGGYVECWCHLIWTGSRTSAFWRRWATVRIFSGLQPHDLYCNYMWYLVTVCCFFLGHNIFCRHFITGWLRKLRNYSSCFNGNLLDLDSSLGRLQQQAALCSLAQSMKQQSAAAPDACVSNNV